MIGISYLLGLVSFKFILLSWLIYALVICVYRLFFSPVQHIPGPFLARITYLYEFYYDVICVGQYIWKVQKLHEQYGPIVLINPHEVHINDPDYYDEVYTGTNKRRDKWHFQSGIMDLQASAFGTLDHDVHRMRRAALNPYFSQAKVRSLQGQVQGLITRLLERWEDLGRGNRPVLLSFAAAALTNDVAMQYAFGHNEHRIESPDFDRSYTEAVDTGAMLAHVLKHIPWLYTISTWLPDGVQAMLAPDLQGFIEAKRKVQDEVKRLHARRYGPDVKASSSATIFHGLLNSSLPECEKDPDRLWQEGYVTVAAGTLTTATAISIICFHLLRQPCQLRKLKVELNTAVPDPEAVYPVTELERLPFLTAVIKEGLRISQGVTYRMARIPCDESLAYTLQTSVQSKTYHIPPGTPVSMTHLDIHLSPEKFPIPALFSPQRWLDDTSHRLDKYLVAFNRGTRICAGMNLAWMELYLTIAMIFRKFGSKEVRRDGEPWLELYETSEEDVEIMGDGSTPLYRKGDRVKVLVHCS